MPLTKQPVQFNFQSGLDTKTDPFQIAIGKFEELQNSIFDRLGRFTKRNGFGAVTALPDNTSSFLTTFNGNLTAIGNDLKAFIDKADIWVNKGRIQPLDLSTLPLIRNSTNQTQSDTAISPNGLICTVYTDNITVVGSTTQYVAKYVVADSTTGQNVLAPTQLTSTFGSVTYFPRVFALSNYFVLVFPSTSNGSTFHLQYATINTQNPSTISSVSDVTTNFSYLPSTTLGSTTSFDGVVANNSLYLSWNSTSNAGLKAKSLNSFLSLSGEVAIASASAAIVSMTADTTGGSTPVIWTAYLQGSQSGRILSTTPSFSILVPPKAVFSSNTATNITLSAQGGMAQVLWETPNNYPVSYLTASVSSSFVSTKGVFSTGSLGATSILARSVGLASRAFIIDSSSYFLSAYQSAPQPTYFLMNSTGAVISKLAYSNGGGYVNTGLPSVNVIGSTANVSYLIKDLVQSVNKGTAIGSSTQLAAIYSQTGINLAKFTLGSRSLVSTEVGNNLNLNGGFLWAYDGYTPQEQGFHLYPDDVVVSISSGGAGLATQRYFYQATYEWSDNQGNIFRSAPSVPVPFSTGSGSVVGAIVAVPTARLTYKISNPAKIVIYRWSETQPVYYQVTSITAPILNNTTIDQVLYTDKTPDSQIIGNNILYTNGGVLENIAGPSFNAITTFDSRLWGISAEDDNTLWFSKQAIPGAPIETSDLLTLFVTPNDGAQGPTGGCKCLAPMDDKLIIFKKNAIYYVNGRGPDNTGANNQYSKPIFITGTVGCDRQKSIILTPNGLMFQSDKGIWMLGRDLSTSYIGKDIERYNDDTVLSAVAVPGTNQVRFNLESGTTLMYDYFVGQWGTFNTPGVSSTLYENLHTSIDQYGRVFQETPGVYLDGSSPVLMSYKTGWLNLAGFQGYQRAYEMFLLGQYNTPHRLTVGVAYDYDGAVTQLMSIVPDNYSGVWGSGSSWGSITTWGGNSRREQWQFNFKQQQCQSFQLSFNEYYDGQFGVAAGAGLTVSGMNVVTGIVKGYPKSIAPKNRTS